MPEREPAAGDVVEPGRGHRGERGGPGVQLEDPRADLEPLGPGRDEAQLAHRVEAVGLGHEHDVQPGLLVVGELGHRFGETAGVVEMHPDAHAPAFRGREAECRSAQVMLRVTGGRAGGTVSRRRDRLRGYHVLPGSRPDRGQLGDRLEGELVGHQPEAGHRAVRNTGHHGRVPELLTPGRVGHVHLHQRRGAHGERVAQRVGVVRERGRVEDHGHPGRGRLLHPGDHLGLVVGLPDLDVQVQRAPGAAGRSPPGRRTSGCRTRPAPSTPAGRGWAR